MCGKVLQQFCGIGAALKPLLDLISASLDLLQRNFKLQLTQTQRRSGKSGRNYWHGMGIISATLTALLAKKAASVIVADIKLCIHGLVNFRKHLWGLSRSQRY